MTRLCATRLAAVLFVLIASDASAQSEDVAVVIANAPIVVKPNTNMAPLRVAAVGTVLRAFEEQGGWIRVQFQDPRFGLRTGYVETKFVRVERATDLRPLDLSVPLSAPTAANQEPAIQAPRAPPSVPAARAVPSRIFLDADFVGFLPSQGQVTTTFARTLFNQTATTTVTYLDLPTSQAVMPSVRFMLGREVGIGARFFMASYAGVATVAVRVPHPTLANRFGTDTSPGLYTREDWTLNLDVEYLYNDRRWRALVLAGPTYLHSSHDLVDRVAYLQNTTSIGGNGITITGTPTVNVSGSGWGFNVGGDLAYFPWRHIGFGGGAFFNYGTLSLTDPLTDRPIVFDLGATALMGGARFRF